MATAAKTTDNTIPVRLNLLVRIDPAKWTAPEAPALDPARLAEALQAMGVTDEQAARLARGVTTPRKGTANETREDVLAAVRGLERLTQAGAVIVDADRQPAR